MEEHIGNAYDKLDELGVNLTGVDKNLNNIAELLDGVYEDYPKIEENDVTKPSINNTKAGKMEINLKGNTEQFTTTGKNFLNVNNASINWGKLTISTINNVLKVQIADGNGGISQGALTNYTNYNFDVTKDYYFSIYRKSGDIQFRQDATEKWIRIPIYIKYSDDTTNFVFVLITQGMTQNYIKLSFETGKTPVAYAIGQYSPTNTLVQNQEAYYNLQLEQGSTATNFEPYTGATASPNSDYPQDVEVVSGENKIKVVNKNLFDKNDLTAGFVNADGTVGGDLVSYRTSNFILVKPNTTYYKTQTGSPRTKFYDKNKQVLDTSTYQDISVGAGAGSFTTPNNAVYFRFSFPISGGSAVDINTIQLEQGSTATTYEEHKEQDFPISLSSRNLINTSDTKNAFLNVSTGTIATSESWITNWSFTNHIKINGDKITLSFGEINTFQSKIGYYNANKEYISGVEGSYTSGTTFTVATNTKYIRFNYRNNVGATNIQLEEGTTATSYQPYYNYELCKIGDYKDYPWKDESTNKWYIHSLIQKIVFDNDSQIKTGSSSTDGYARVGYGLETDIGWKSNSILGVYCNKFKGVIQNENTPSITGQHWYISNTNVNDFRILFRSGDLSLNGSQLATLIKTSGIYIYCFRKTPTDIEITNTTLINQLEAIYNTAKSYDNVTNIIQENNNLPFILDIKTLKKS
jgi:hypothetical protein